jgi:hypothetical protein
MTEPTPQKLMNDFMDGMSQAFGGAWQLAHMHSDPRWLIVRDGIGSIKDTCVTLMMKLITQAMAGARR